MTESPHFSFQQREDFIQNICAKEWDLVVIGGGATGAACARDAALRGLSVCLLEAGDFSSGTSSGSSKLIHGGIRYLQNFEFRLVFEAIRERERLEKLYAPLIKKIPFLFPTYKKQWPPKSLLRSGLLLYDSFSFFKEKHQSFSASKTAEQFPYLKPDQLTGALMYSDSFVEDFRMVIELIKSAYREGALCLSRSPVTRIEARDSGFEIEFQDQFSTEQPHFQIKTKAVLNCAGPFSDQVRQLLKLEDRLHLTQGVHFVVPRQKLPLQTAIVLSDPELERILFAVPWNRVTYLGTTDTAISHVAEAQAQASDLDYVLKIANRHFQHTLKAEDVIQSWAAVRPLIRPPKELSNSKISREHQIEENPAGCYHLLGGKLTSHRLMAEEAVDLVCKKLGTSESSKTRDKPLHEKAWKLGAADHLSFRYGRYASDVLAYDKKMNLNKKLILNDHSDLEAEVYYAIYHEMALTPLDFLRRRSSLYYETGDLQAAEKVFQIYKNVQALKGSQLESSWSEVVQSYQWDQKALQHETTNSHSL